MNFSGIKHIYLCWYATVRTIHFQNSSGKIKTLWPFAITPMTFPSQSLATTILFPCFISLFFKKSSLSIDYYIKIYNNLLRMLSSTFLRVISLQFHLLVNPFSDFGIKIIHHKMSQEVGLIFYYLEGILYNRCYFCYKYLLGLTSENPVSTALHFAFSVSF